MPNELTSITLTFFTLRDFVEEVRRRNLTTVRCERGSRDFPARNAPSPPRRHLVVLTALDAPEACRERCRTVLAYPVLIGESWTIFAKDQPHADNLSKAKDLVEAHLTSLGLEVRPGMYHHDTDGLATASGLWRLDEDRWLHPRPKEADDG